MLKIYLEHENVLVFEKDNGEKKPIIYKPEFGTDEKNGNLIRFIIQEGSLKTAFAEHFNNIEVNGIVNLTVIETLSAINKLCSVFKKGGGVTPPVPPIIEAITITENGKYTVDDFQGLITPHGFNPVTVDVQAEAGWQPQPDWWDIEQIFKDDPDPNKRAIILLTDSLPSFNFDRNYIGNANAYYKTSDGYIYNGNALHTWDTTMDKPCAMGYKTRWVMVYSSDVSISIISNINYNDNLKYVFVGNSTDINYVELKFCSLLEAFRTEKNVKSMNMGLFLFSSCFSLKKVDIPASVTSMGAALFSNAVSLLSIRIENGWISPSFSIENSTFFPESSAIELFTRLGNAPTARTLTFGSTLLERWSQSTKDIAINKGYTLA